MKYINVPQSTYWGSKYAYHSEILANLRQALVDGIVKEIPKERARYYLHGVVVTIHGLKVNLLS